MGKERRKKNDTVSKAMFVNSMKTLCLTYLMLITLLLMLEKMRFHGYKVGIEVGLFLESVALRELRMKNLHPF